MVENLAGLEQIEWDDPLISVLPLRLTGADGSPTRAVAIEIEPLTGQSPEEACC